MIVRIYIGFSKIKVITNVGQFSLFFKESLVMVFRVN